VATDADLATLFERLDPVRPLARIASATFKRWPVGSRGQSAIQAALQARAGVADIWKAREVNVTCDSEVYQHLLARRADPWHPSSRETADHSLPYIVTAAVLDGAMGVESFDPTRVCDAALQGFMNEKVKIEPSPALSRGAAGGFLTQVRIVDEAGNVHVGKAAPPPGHADQRFGPADFELKFRENVAPVLGARNAEAILHAVTALDTMQDVRTLTSLLAADDVGLRSA
jgi:2-methylcitrate dehydratase